MSINGMDETDALDRINREFFENYVPPDDDDNEDISESIIEIIKKDEEIKEKIITENKVVSSGIEKLRNSERVTSSSSTSSSTTSSTIKDSSSGYNTVRKTYYGTEKKETVSETIDKQFNKMREYGYKIAKEEEEEAKSKKSSYKALNPQLEELMGKRNGGSKSNIPGVNKLKKIVEPGSSSKKWLLIGGVLVLKGIARIIYLEQQKRES